MGKFLPYWFRHCTTLILVSVYIFVNPGIIHAIDLGVATYVEVAEASDQSVEDGSLMVSTLEGLYLSRYPYDPALIGIATLNSAIVLGVKQDTSIPMASKGNVAVRVSTINGPILKGDILTSSSIPGVAMKATRAGTAVGTALEDYNEQDTSRIGKIMVLINIQFNQNGASNAEEEAITLGVILRSVMATILALVTTIVGFIFFGRFALKGVESLGRNPSAAKTIRLGMVLQGLLFIVLIAVGYILSYLLVR